MRTPIVLYLLALVVRSVLFALFPDPAYPDSFYYVEVARSIASGQGLNVDFIWIFAEVGARIPDVPTLPIPSNAHWLPLSSFLQAPFITILGPTALASALPGLLIGSLAAPLTWAIARDAGSAHERGRERRASSSPFPARSPCSWPSRRRSRSRCRSSRPRSGQPLAGSGATAAPSSWPGSWLASSR